METSLLPEYARPNPTPQTMKLLWGKQGSKVGPVQDLLQKSISQLKKHKGMLGTTYQRYSRTTEGTSPESGGVDEMVSNCSIRAEEAMVKAESTLKTIVDFWKQLHHEQTLAREREKADAASARALAQEQKLQEAAQKAAERRQKARARKPPIKLLPKSSKRRSTSYFSRLFCLLL